VVLDGAYPSTLSGLQAAPPATSLADLGIHLIALVENRREEPGAVDLRLLVNSDGSVTEDTEESGTDSPEDEHTPLKGQADRSSIAHLHTLARSLALYGLSPSDSHDAMHETAGLPALLRFHD